MQRDTPSRLVGYAHPSQDMSLLLKLDVSVERTNPRVHAFFVPLGSGESQLRITPTFTGRQYYSKTATLLRGGFQMNSLRLSGNSGGDGCAATIGFNAFSSCGTSL